MVYHIKSSKHQQSKDKLKSKMLREKDIASALGHMTRKRIEKVKLYLNNRMTIE